MKGIGLQGSVYQSYGTLANTPWALKAVIGLLSDTIPLFGYHKRLYMIFSSMLGTIAFLALGLLPINARGAPLAGLFMLLGQLQLATVDLLCEGKYAEQMVANPQSGTDLVTWVWLLYTLGTFVGSAVAGPVADRWQARYVYLVCAPLAAQVIIPTALGWLPEQRLPARQRGVLVNKLKANLKLVKLTGVMTAGALAVGLSALVPGPVVQSTVSVTVAVALCFLGHRWLPRTLARANLYMFLSATFYVNLTGSTDYFYTASPQCLPNGPNFSYTFFVTYGSLVGSAASAMGVAVFQVFLSRGKLRRAFLTTTLIKLSASLFDIFIVKRLNLRAEIPDKVAFLFGDAIIYQLAVLMDFMPAAVLISKLCPKGLEASIYAILASYQNLGQNCARSIGVALSSAMGIRTTVPCDFTRLSEAIFIGHVLMPLLIVPLLFVLIPDASVTDDLQTDRSHSNEELDELVRP